MPERLESARAQTHEEDNIIIHFTIATSVNYQYHFNYQVFSMYFAQYLRPRLRHCMGTSLCTYLSPQEVRCAPQVLIGPISLSIAAPPPDRTPDRLLPPE